MSDQDISAELEKLKAEVAQLSAARQAEASTPEPEQEPERNEETRTSSGPDLEDPDESQDGIADKFRHQIEELGDLLEAEIRDLPTITCLAVFSLGIMLGRHLK